MIFAEFTPVEHDGYPTEYLECFALKPMLAPPETDRTFIVDTLDTNDHATPAQRTVEQPNSDKGD